MTTNTERKHVRKKPKPTKEEALDFARSVMLEQGAFKNWSVYKYEDGLTVESSLSALQKHAVDMSEFMALEMCLYTLEE